MREAGKTLDNAQSDLREAVDFLRYYGAEARRSFAGRSSSRARRASATSSPCMVAASSPASALELSPGHLHRADRRRHSPPAMRWWPSPPSRRRSSPIRAVQLLHAAGVPPEVLQFLPGRRRDGRRGAARAIRASMASPSPAPTTPALPSTGRSPRATGRSRQLIAETGGKNCMIVDSSALPEQAVRDALASAFDSAGQRCSASRVLFLQEDVAGTHDRHAEGRGAELSIGDPLDYATDVGPVIDDEAKTGARSPQGAHGARGARADRSAACRRRAAHGTFVAPAVYEFPSLKLLTREVFGPVLHVVRFAGDRLGEVCAAINATGYGLTLGLHTRMQNDGGGVRGGAGQGRAISMSTATRSARWSAPSPSAARASPAPGRRPGGPNYLQRFAVERVCSTDTTASGGNAALLAAASDDD